MPPAVLVGELGFDKETAAAIVEKRATLPAGSSSSSEVQAYDLALTIAAVKAPAP